MLVEDVDGEKEMEVPDDCVAVDEDVDEDVGLPSLKRIFDFGCSQNLCQREKVGFLMLANFYEINRPGSSKMCWQVLI